VRNLLRFWAFVCFLCGIPTFCCFGTAVLGIAIASLEIGPPPQTVEKTLFLYCAFSLSILLNAMGCLLLTALTLLPPRQKPPDRDRPVAETSPPFRSRHGFGAPKGRQPLAPGVNPGPLEGPALCVNGSIVVSIRDQ
jgi:hypothetical protein